MAVNISDKLLSCTPMQVWSVDLQLLFIWWRANRLTELSTSRVDVVVMAVTINDELLSCTSMPLWRLYLQLLFI